MEANNQKHFLVSIKGIGLALLSTIVVFLTTRCDEGVVYNPSFYVRDSKNYSSVSYFHIKKDCEDGLELIKDKDSVYSLELSAANFCRKCVTPETRDFILERNRERLEREDKAREHEEHLSTFYNAFNREFEIFESETEFHEWLHYYADRIDMYLLYGLFETKFEDFDDAGELMHYLNWTEPDYSELLYDSYDNREYNDAMPYPW